MSNLHTLMGTPTTPYVPLPQVQDAELKRERLDRMKRIATGLLILVTIVFVVAHLLENDSNVVILSYSVTPEIDRVPRLAHYAQQYQIHSKTWHLLTGARTDIERLARDSYFVELRDKSGNTQGDLRHTETLVLVDGTRRIRGVYSGTLAYDVYFPCATHYPKTRAIAPILARGPEQLFD